MKVVHALFTNEYEVRFQNHHSFPKMLRRKALTVHDLVSLSGRKAKHLPDMTSIASD